MCSCDFESADFSFAKNVTARKSHHCEECRSVIAPGETYERTTGGYEGSMFSYALCLGCRAWASALHKAQREACGCSGWELGRMWEAVEEFAEEHLSERAMRQRAREAERKARMTSVVMTGGT